VLTFSDLSMSRFQRVAYVISVRVGGDLPSNLRTSVAETGGYLNEVRHLQNVIVATVGREGVVSLLLDVLCCT